MREQEFISLMLAYISVQIIEDTEKIMGGGKDNPLSILLKAYNTYQEEERDGVDYIFDLYDQDDLLCCVEGGLTAREIASLYEHSTKDKTHFFFFGQNHQVPEQIKDLSSLRDQLLFCLDEILECVMTFPECEGYSDLYKRYVSEIFK